MTQAQIPAGLALQNLHLPTSFLVVVSRKVHEVLCGSPDCNGVVRSVRRAESSHDLADFASVIGNVFSSIRWMLFCDDRTL